MKRRLTTAFIILLLALAPAAAQAAPDHGAMIEAFLKKPAADELRYIDLIIPLQKLGPFTFSLRREDVLLYLGEPDRIFYRDRTYTVKNPPERCYFVYHAVGVSFLFDGGAIAEMTAFSPRFRFPSGLGAGGTEAQAVAAFGPGYRLAPGETQDTLAYETLGLSFRVSKQKRIIWEIVLTQGPGQSQPPSTFDDLLNREIPKLDLARTTLDELVRLFGEPLAFRWGNKTFTRGALPSYYVAEFKNRFTALMRGNAVVELGFHQAGFKLGGVLGVGATLPEAVAYLGAPRDTVAGVSRDFQSGVLYVNMAGEEGTCYYERADWGVRLFFKNFKISAIYLTVPR